MAKTRPIEEHNFPKDIWFEVLSRIPVKSLMRFRSVSKSLRTFIEHPDFVRLHLTRFNNCHESHLLVVEQLECVVKCSESLRTTFRLGSLKSELGSTYTPRTAPVPLGIRSNSEYWRLISSIDGLVLLQESCSRVPHGCIPNVMLWNPSIRKTRLLPPPPFPEIHFNIVDFGLGFDPLSKDYKLVRFAYTYKMTSRMIPCVHSVAIYTVGTNSWRTIDFRAKGWCETHSFLHFNVPFCFKGVLYGFAIEDYYLISGPFMVSFDLSSEMFASITLPAIFNVLYPKFLTTIDDGSSLALVDIYRPNHVAVWVLDNLGSWTLRYNFDSIFRIYPMRFMYLKKNGEMLLASQMIVTSCNLETQGEHILLHQYIHERAWPYLESLILL